MVNLHLQIYRNKKINKLNHQKEKIISNLKQSFKLMKIKEKIHIL